MGILDINDAQQQLHCLVEEAARGHDFAIAKTGKSLVQVLPLTAPASGGESE